MAIPAESLRGPSDREEFLREIARRARPRNIVIATMRVPCTPIVSLLRRAKQPAIVWRAAASAIGRACACVGFGEVVRIEASGRGRLNEVAAQASALFERVEEVVEAVDCDLPTVRLLGGISFRSSEQSRGTTRHASASVPRVGVGWSRFAEASFTLPRCLYIESDGRAFVRVAFSGEELLEQGPEAQLERCFSLFAAPRYRSGLDRQTPSEQSLERPSAERAHASWEQWRATIEDALAAIEGGKLDKVVAATATRVRGTRALEPTAVVGKLVDLYPACTIFAIPRGSSTFVGASPERLVRVAGLSVESEALAGTTRHGPGDAAALLKSDKDRREHELVVRAIRQVLVDLCDEVKVGDRPTIRTVTNVSHLHTPMTGRLARPRHVLELVARLHPTPAVCGLPRDAALDWIARCENLDRGWYAGAVGWFDAAGDGDFSVAIRSALLEGRDAMLFAGAGIVRGSDPRRELEEIAIKRSAMWAALGTGPL